MAKGKHSARYRILIVGDHKLDNEEVVRLSFSTNAHIDQAVDSSWAMEQFDREPSDVLLLCHGTVQAALSFYMNFLMHSQKALDSEHQTILLCDGKEVREAYDICSNQFMDDYVVYKPLFDIYKLKFSINKALERIDYINYAKLMELRVKRMIEDMDYMKDVLAKHIKKIHGYKQESIDVDDQVKATIETGFSRLKKKIDSLMNESQEKILNENYKIIKNETIESTLNHYHELSEKNGGVDWINSMLMKFGEVSNDIEITLKENLDEKSVNDVKILIVEDELVNQKMMDLILTDEGYLTKIANDGEKAIFIAQKWMPDVILMDIRMPKINGLKVVKLLKSKPEFKKTIIIMLTAHSEKVVVSECLKAGALDFIVKPSKKDVLIERIEHFLSER